MGSRKRDPPAACHRPALSGTSPAPDRRYTSEVPRDLTNPAERPAGPAWLTAGYAQAVAVVAAATGLSWLMFPFVDPANLIMTYLLGVVVIATRYGRGASVLASAASVAAFDFFFVPPHLTFAVADTQYVMTFAVMLLVGLVISGLTLRIRRQAEAARQREQRTAALYAMSRELAGTSAVEDLVGIAVRHIEDVFGAEIAVLLPDAEGRLAASPIESGGLAVDENDLELGRWVIEHRRPAGLGTATSASARAVYLPLLGHRGALGVVSVRPRQRDALRTPEPLRQLETFVNQTALALEACGVARLALEDALEYASSREQFGKKIGVYQAVSHPLADAYTRVELSRSLALWAAWCVATGDAQASIAAAAAKSYAGESAVAVCETAIQALGGIGFTWEHRLQRLYKRALGIESFGASGTRLRAEIAASLIEQDAASGATPTPVTITQGG